MRWRKTRVLGKITANPLFPHVAAARGKRQRRGALIMTAGGVVVFCGVLWLLLGKYWNVTEITIEGTRDLSAEALQQQVQATLAGRTWYGLSRAHRLALDTAQITTALEREGTVRVQEVHVNGTVLQLMVEERVIGALISADATSWWVADWQDMLLRAVNEEELAQRRETTPAVLLRGAELIEQMPLRAGIVACARAWMATLAQQGDPLQEMEFLTPDALWATLHTAGGKGILIDCRADQYERATTLATLRADLTARNLNPDVIDLRFGSRVYYQ